MRTETVLLRIAGLLVLAAMVYAGWRDYNLARGLYDYSTQANGEGIVYLSRAIDSPDLSRWEKSLAYLSRGQLYGRERDFAAAASDASAAISLSPDYTAAHLTRAGAYILTRNFEGAREDLDVVIARDPWNEVARQLRGNLLWQQGNWRGAIADYDVAEEAEHQTPYFYYQRGNAFARMRAFGGAIAAYDAAIAGDPDLDEAWRNRGVMHLFMGDLGAALADFNAAIRLNPNVADWYAGRGDVYTAAGGFGEAISDYDKALGMDDSLLTTHRNRAFANFGRADFADAAKEFDLCAARAPNDVYIALWGYIAHERAGDDDKPALRRFAAQTDLTKWPGPAVSMFLGRIQPADLINVAMQAPPQFRNPEDCEATSFAGEWEMIQGDKDKAQLLFHRVDYACHPATLAHAAAVAEIDRANGFSR